MKRNIFKVLGLFLALVLGIFLIPVNGMATEGTQIDGTGIYWRIEGSELILEYSGTGETNIPDAPGPYSPGSYPWRYNNDITTVTIGEGITGIGNSAFHDMKGVSTVNWPSTLKTIGSDVFAVGKHGLDSIVVGEGVESIGATFFGDNPPSDHSSITFPSTLETVSDALLFGVIKDGGTVTFLGNPPTVTGGGVLVNHWADGRKFHLVVPYGTKEAYASIVAEGLIIDITELPPKTEPKTDTCESANPAHVHKFEWQVITEPTKDTDGLEGEMCSCGATRNTQKLSAYGYALNEYATPLINKAVAGQTVTFEFGEWNSFPKSFMEKIAAKSMEGVTFVFRYKWNHEKQEITIPFGTAVDTQFDWYGPAKMAELYGMN